MRRKLVIDGNAVYEIDDECARRKEGQKQKAIPQDEKPAQKTAAKETGPMTVDTLGDGYHGCGMKKR